GAANKHISRSGLLERFGLISNRPANETCHARVADTGPARPPDWDVTRFSEFEQTLIFRIPCGCNSAARKRNCWSRRGRSFWWMRSVSNLGHSRCNSFQRAEDFRVHILAGHTPTSETLAHAPQE